MEVMKQVHEGVCGAHQSGVKMQWLPRRHNYFFPTILKDASPTLKAVNSAINMEVYKGYLLLNCIQ